MTSRTEIIILAGLFVLLCVPVAFATATPAQTTDLPLPFDPDGDGRYEDVNADGTVNFHDVTALFEHLDEIAARGPPVIALYDYNANGRIDFADVVALFQEVAR